MPNCAYSYQLGYLANVAKRCAHDDGLVVVLLKIVVNSRDRDDTRVLRGGYVGDAGADSLFPVLLVRLNDVIYEVVVSMDDEQNGGGRLFIEGEQA